MKKLVLILLILTLTACATIQEQGYKLTQKVCDMSEDDRTALQATSDSMTAPNKIRIECN
jgi:DNA-binding winged helix-turn-helix (wHTH) protein